MRQIRILIGETEFNASFLEKEAPITCQAFWELLPIGSDLHHAKIAGNEVMTTFPQRLKMPEKIENKTYIKDMKPGDLGITELNLVMVYGEVSKEPMPVNVFARASEEDDREKMKRACISVWRKNGQRILIERKAQC